MRTEQLEAWVLSIVDDVATGRAVEDSRVELKADWPKAESAARRIAGHANAAGSDSILWIIGLDEERGVVPFTPSDFATWLPQVEAAFDELAPSVKDLVVPTGSGPVVALLFDVSRRPFVVRNATFGQPGGGSVSLEVPWRRGTSVASARRNELLRVLVPRQTLPLVEMLGATANVATRGPADPADGGEPSNLQLAEHLEWNVQMSLYVTPSTTDLLVLPTHKAALVFAIGSEAPQTAIGLRFFAPYRSGGISVIDSSTVTTAMGEAVFRGPGLVHVRAWHNEAVRSLPPNADFSATLSVSPAGSDLRTEVTFRLSTQGKPIDDTRSWTLAK